MRVVKLVIVFVMLVSLLGCMTVSETGQHSEIVAKVTAKEMLEALAEYEVVTKTDIMKQMTIIYLRKKEH